MVNTARSVVLISARDETRNAEKVRELIDDLEQAGFTNRGGKGSHRNFVHPSVRRPNTLAGKLGDDAKRYQERAVARAIKESLS